MEKPNWWNRYYKNWSEECEKFYQDNRDKITTMKKNMDWDNGIRSVTYSGDEIETKEFIETF